MVEILWNSDAPHSAVKDHEMVELRVVELGGAARPSFLVREIHAAWSAAAQQIEWKGFKDETYVSAGDAQHSIADRRKAAVKAGFAYRTVLN